MEGLSSLRGGFWFPTWSEQGAVGVGGFVGAVDGAATGDAAGQDTLAVARERDPPVAAR